MRSNVKAWIALSAAIVLTIVVIAATAQPPADATYKGSKACVLCHKNSHAAIVQGYDRTGHAKAFADAAQTPTAIVAQFGEEAPFKKEQIKYVLGAGKAAQAYMDASFQVLPGEWDAANKRWKPTSAVDGSKQCIGCHVTGYKPEAKTWVQASVGCESCHGPGSAHAASGDKKKILNPKTLPKDREAVVCGQCHSKGTDPTKTYAFPTSFRPGDDLAKVFVDAKPTARGRNQQYSEMIGSKHLANGVVCTTCHEPHGAGAAQSFQLRKPVTDLCLGCHKDKEIAKHAPGAPEGATCATCHMMAGSHTFRKLGE